MDFSKDLMHLPVGRHICCCSMESASDLFVTQRVAFASGAWVANAAIFCPFTIEQTTAFPGGFWVNGTSSPNTGNLDVGVYDMLGNRLASSGSTAQAGGTNATQTPNFSGGTLTLTPGAYMMGLAGNNSSTTLYRVAFLAATQAAFGVQRNDSAFALPSTITFGGGTGAPGLPFFGLRIESVI